MQISWLRQEMVDLIGDFLYLHKIKDDGKISAELGAVAEWQTQRT